MSGNNITASEVADYVLVETQFTKVAHAMHGVNENGGVYFTGVVLFTTGDYGYTTFKGDLFLFVTPPLAFFDCIKNNGIDEETWMNHLTLMYHGPNGLNSYVEEVRSLHTHYPHMGISIEREVAAYRPI